MTNFILRLIPHEGSFLYNTELPVFWRDDGVVNIGNCTISHDENGMRGTFVLTKAVIRENFIRYYFMWPDTDDRALASIIITDNPHNANTIGNSILI